ncbi:hypothetical protein P3K83_17525, partial [Bacillus cytotoxicus]
VCRIVNVAQTTPYPKAIHLPPTHWATPFTFLEVGVFSPIVDKLDRKEKWLFIALFSHTTKKAKVTFDLCFDIFYLNS